MCVCVMCNVCDVCVCDVHVMCMMCVCDVRVHGFIYGVLCVMSV